MIQIKPFTYNDFTCPVCHHKHIRNDGVLIEGLHAMADNLCLQCGFGYLQHLPVGHTVDFPISYGKKNAVIYDNSNAWVTKGLSKYFEPPREGSIEIKRVVKKRCSSVVLLNALDFLYGHTLLKLFNCQHHLDQDPELGLIVMIPRNFEWLVPAGCAEVWIVNIPLSSLHYRHAAIQGFVRDQLDRFESVFLSRAYTHPDFLSIEITRFTGVVPFDLSRFGRTPLQITFVLREDRFWIDNRAIRTGLQVLRWLGLGKAASRRFALRQNTLVRQTIRIIKKSFPDAAFVVVGMGHTGTIEGAADRRVIQVEDETERLWCETYAKSHLVIGVHGSNMILPTAHAAACIEILPDDRIPNIVQDIAVRCSDRRQLFLYRFLNEFAGPASVAAHAVSILNGYKTFNQNMCCNQYTLVDDEDSSMA